MSISLDIRKLGLCVYLYAYVILVEMVIASPKKSAASVGFSHKSKGRKVVRFAEEVHHIMWCLVA